jgi:hypothetical protein
LNHDNVALYLDAGHAGWLGWPGNLNTTAQVFGAAYKEAGKPNAVRGLVTNVSNFNAVRISHSPSPPKHWTFSVPWKTPYGVLEPQLSSLAYAKRKEPKEAVLLTRKSSPVQRH